MRRAARVTSAMRSVVAGWVASISGSEALPVPDLSAMVRLRPSRPAFEAL